MSFEGEVGVEGTKKTLITLHTKKYLVFCVKIVGKSYSLWKKSNFLNSTCSLL